MKCPYVIVLISLCITIAFGLLTDWRVQASIPDSIAHCPTSTESLLVSD
jgi:hypothetical protein